MRQHTACKAADGWSRYLLRSRPFVLAGALAILPAAEAAAQQVTVEEFVPAPLQPGAIISLWGSEPQRPGTYTLSLSLNVHEVPSADGAAALDGTSGTAVSTGEVQATVGVWHSFDVTAALALHRSPSHDATNSASSESQSSLGDARVIPRVRLLSHDKVGLAALLPVWVPAGEDSKYGAYGVRLQPTLASQVAWEGLTFTANVGYLLHPATIGWGADSHNLATGGFGVELGPFGAWSVLTELVARSSVHAPFLEGLVAEIRPAVGFAVDDWAVRVGGGTSLLAHDEEGRWRLFATVSFSPFHRPKTPLPPTPDRDSDTLEDALDRCPEEPETFNGIDDDDGCPDGEADSQAYDAPDDDADGETYDASDDELAVSDESEAASSFPSAGSRGQATRAETAAAEPLHTTSGESHCGVNACETGEPGTPLFEINEVIYFEPNEMRLDAKQLAAIDAVVALLKASPKARIVVMGHSDGTGPWHFNRTLSRTRASTVRYHLIQRGVSWTRIEMVGYGATRPAVDEGTAADRAKNRRVEFRVLAPTK